MANLDLLVQKLLRRPTCVLGKGARLGRPARIRNIRGNSEAISIGSKSIVMGELLTFAHGGKIFIGEWCYIGEGSRVWSAASIQIHDRVLIAHGVNIFDNLTHPLDGAKRHEQFKQIATVGHPRQIDLGERPVVIHDDAWIGAGAFVLRGVTIGCGAIVAAGSVVTKDVPANSIVAGNPAMIVREADASIVIRDFPNLQPHSSEMPQQGSETAPVPLTVPNRPRS
jgi:acetyltransferase-like isoleucine patch superfamily enzyme